MEPSHNLDALFLGTGEFSFCEGAETLAEALPKGFMDFGNVRALTPNVESTKVVHKGSYRGKLKRDKQIVTEHNLDYVLRCDEWKQSNMLILFGGTAAAQHTQLVKTAANADAIAFSAGTPADPDKWYQIAFSGVHYMHLTTVTIATLTEGTDFVLDLLLGRIRFLTAQTASLVPVVTSAVITTGSVNSMLGITPLDTITHRGLGRLTLYDQNDDTHIVLDHRDFVCEISLENVGEINGENWTELQIRVTISAEDPGTVYLRQNCDD